MAELISATVSFEAAKKLAEAGYDQTRHFGLWYGETGFVLLAESGRRTPSPSFYFGPRPTWLSKVDTLTAAPAHLQAAAFLASKDYVVNFFITEPPKPGNLWAQSEYGDEVIPDKQDPDSFILAICEHMEAANEET